MMSFRFIEISNELHIRNHQLLIQQKEKEIVIPLEDLIQIFCIGQDIRISTKALSIISHYKITLITE